MYVKQLNHITSGKSTRGKATQEFRNRQLVVSNVVFFLLLLLLLFLLYRFAFIAFIMFFCWKRYRFTSLIHIESMATWWCVFFSFFSSLSIQMICSWLSIDFVFTFFFAKAKKKKQNTFEPKRRCGARANSCLLLLFTFIMLWHCVLDYTPMIQYMCVCVWYVHVQTCFLFCCFFIYFIFFFFYNWIAQPFSFSI